MASTFVAMYPDQQIFFTSEENESQSPEENSRSIDGRKRSSKKTKRSRNPDNWKKEKRKRAILSGQAYLNTKGELVGPRSMGPDCNCKHRCFINVSTDSRLAIFKGYYSLKSYDEQNAYLYGLIRRYDIQRKRKPVSERRTCSYKYFVRVKGREVQVCKKAFANIHGISDKKIRTLCIKHEQNILFPRDNRGRHNNRPKKVTPELVTMIKHHILRMLSGTSVGEFIKTDKNQGPDVNISKLHKNFLQEYQPEAIDRESDKVVKDSEVRVKSWLYFKVFHEEFNSMDFNTVKRKLCDLRKSLEVSSSHQGKKKAGGAKSPRGARGKGQKEEAGQGQGQVIVPASVQPLSYVGGAQPQGTPGFPHNIQLSMLSLQHLNGSPHCSPTAFPHSGGSGPQQPLNLQTGTPVGVEQPLPQGTQHPQALTLNLDSVGATPHSYYLCFGHVSNLIPIPVSSGGSTHNPQPHQSHFSQHNPQQFAPNLLQPHQPPPPPSQHPMGANPPPVIQSYCNGRVLYPQAPPPAIYSPPDRVGSALQ